MTEFLADSQPRLSVQGALHGIERCRQRTARRRCLPAGQLLIAVLRILVSKPVELREPGVGRVSFVDAKLLAVVPVAGDQ